METEKSKYLRTTSCQSPGDHASHTLAHIPQGHPSGPALSALYLFLSLFPTLQPGNVFLEDLEASLSSVSLAGDGSPSPGFCEPERSPLVHRLLSQRHKKACIPFRQNHVLKHGCPVFPLSPQVLRNPPTLCFSRNEFRLSSALSPLLRLP